MQLRPTVVLIILFGFLLFLVQIEFMLSTLSGLVSQLGVKLGLIHNHPKHVVYENEITFGSDE